MSLFLFPLFFSFLSFPFLSRSPLFFLVEEGARPPLICACRWVLELGYLSLMLFWEIHWLFNSGYIYKFIWVSYPGVILVPAKQFLHIYPSGGIWCLWLHKDISMFHKLYEGNGMYWLMRTDSYSMHRLEHLQRYREGTWLGWRKFKVTTQVQGYHQGHPLSNQGHSQGHIWKSFWRSFKVLRSYL